MRQEWHKWKVDAVLPMLYNGFYNEDLSWVGRECRTGIERMQQVGVSKPLYSGLFLPDAPPEKLEAAIDTSLEGGADGISLFAYNGIQPEHLQIMERRFG